MQLLLPPCSPYVLLLRGRLPLQTVNQPRRSSSSASAGFVCKALTPLIGRRAQDGSVPSPLCSQGEPIARRVVRARAQALKSQRRSSSSRSSACQSRAELSSHLLLRGLARTTCALAAVGSGWVGDGAVIPTNAPLPSTAGQGDSDAPASPLPSTPGCTQSLLSNIKYSWTHVPVAGWTPMLGWERWGVTLFPHQCGLSWAPAETPLEGLD